MWIFEFSIEGQEAAIAVLGSGLIQAQARAAAIVEARNGAPAQLIRSIEVGRYPYF